MFELNKIYNCDALEFMKQVPDKYFDLVLTDPPYGINASNASWNYYSSPFGGSKAKTKNAATYASSYEIKDWDKSKPTNEIFEQIIRISKNQIIFGGNYFIESLHNSSCWLFWDKDNGDNDFADGELAWTSFKTAVRKYKYRWNGMLQQDMANKETRYHPTQKPVELFKLILRDYAKEGFKVYDPFVGSGTTPLACEGLPHLKLEWVGTELEPDYVAIANKRLEKVQGSLF